MQFIDKPVKLNEIWANRATKFSKMLKMAVDIQNEWIVLDGELHADCEAVLLQKGSQQENIWGANIYPAMRADDFLDYIAFINIRPSQNNPSMEVLDPQIRDRVKQIVQHLLIAD